MKKSCCLDRASLREMVQYTTFNSNLPDNRVSLAETTPDGTKWFLTGAGLVRLFRRGDRLPVGRGTAGKPGVPGCPGA
ncbi:hypothetical protein ACP3TJ_02035 [Desulforudis sp. 1088]|uniref:hypothetical protein n=1 Tax=unclassified Candidatus Desulforudis TaxID=2635950 RepID=UPI003CE49E2B